MTGTYAPHVTITHGPDGRLWVICRKHGYVCSGWDDYPLHTAVAAHIRRLHVDVIRVNDDGTVTESEARTLDGNR